MKKIRLLSVSFNSLIKSYEIPALRAAIAKKAGYNSVLFHNHLGDNKYNYQYPLIQYKTIKQKPALLCIEKGVDEVHHFFQNTNRDIEISGRKLDMSVDDLRLNTFTMQVWDKMWKYTLRNWIALNQDNYKKFKTLEEDHERMDMLERMLKGNILSFAKGIDWHVDKEIKVKIYEINSSHKVKLKNNHLMGFNILFKINVFLPNNLGLGKGVSHGYGIVKEIKGKRNSPQDE